MSGKFARTKTASSHLCFRSTRRLQQKASGTCGFDPRHISGSTRPHRSKLQTSVVLPAPLTLLSIHFEKAMRSENVRLKKCPEVDAWFRGCCFVDHYLLILRGRTGARSTPEKNFICESAFP